MAKTPEEIKNLVEEWLQVIGKPYENITSTNPNAIFGFKFGNIMIYSLKNRVDRIIFETIIGFASEHKEATGKLDDKDWQEFMVQLVEPLTIARLGVILGQEKTQPKQINHIVIHGYVDTDSMNRGDFFKEWDAVAGFREIIIKKIQIKFGVKGKLTSDPTSSSDNTMYN